MAVDREQCPCVEYVDRFLDAKYFVVTVRTVKDACFMTIKPSISKQFTISYIISVVPLHGEVATICTRSDMIAPSIRM